MCLSDGRRQENHATGGGEGEKVDVEGRDSTRRKELAHLKGKGGSNRNGPMPTGTVFVQNPRGVG